MTEEEHFMAIDASAVGKELPETTFEYTDRDVMLYALGVGATAQDLKFVFEKNLQTLPTHAPGEPFWEKLSTQPGHGQNDNPRPRPSSTGMNNRCWTSMHRAEHTENTPS